MGKLPRLASSYRDKVGRFLVVAEEGSIFLAYRIVITLFFIDRSRLYPHRYPHKIDAMKRFFCEMNLVIGYKRPSDI